MIDLVVVGAGPAGLFTAIHAARAGLEAVVLDPRSDAPIDKACGEGVMPGALRALGELGVAVEGHPIVGIRYVAGEHRAQATFRLGPGAGIRRTWLQSALLERALELGVRFCSDRPTEVAQDETSVTVAGLRASYLAAADGLHSPIRRQLGLELAAKPAALKRWGVRQHFAVTPWSDFVEVHWGREAELYVTPVASDLVSIAVLSSRRAAFAEHLAGFPAVARRVGQNGVTQPRGAGPLRQTSKRRVAGRVFLVGDASGYVDALTGEGISVAQSCAAELVRCVLRGRPLDYERRWMAASRRYRVITETMLWARGQPRVAPLIVPAAAKIPAIFSLAVNQLAR
ncbi:MAG: monooxygenase [Frankiales bacterium]|jgi:flavin-dependent dehydrogenase|nr:monooxygenase [Frankiales bacterium]